MEVDPTRLRRACQLLVEAAERGREQKWLKVFRALEEMGWAEENEVADACLHAKPEWLAKVGRTLTRPDHGSDPLELIRDALRVFEGSSVAQIRWVGKETPRTGGTA